VDTLTGLATRKDLLAQYECLAAEGVTSARPLALIVANLDHFKPINMEFGILVGDQVLEEVAALFIQNAPARGVVARIGGDLFALVWRANLSIARECADSLSVRLKSSGVIGISCVSREAV
jgi:diguanylate cyclase (GGDEF)-like protein